MPIGNKKDIRVPSVIFQGDSEIKSSFLRGLSDTDLCLTFKKKNYPVIQGSFYSKLLVKDISKLLNDININHITAEEKLLDKRVNKFFDRYVLYINGHKRVND